MTFGEMQLNRSCGGDFRGGFLVNVGAFICPCPDDRVYSCLKVSTYGLKILYPKGCAGSTPALSTNLIHLVTITYGPA